MLLTDHKPFCLVDLGLGVGKQVIEIFGHFPKQVIITHNHSDHAGELPVVLRVEQAKGHKMTVFADAKVGGILREARLAEHHQVMDSDAIANWQLPAAGECIELSHGLQITFYPGIHSDYSCGFILTHNGAPRLSYTGDSTLDKAFYTLLDQAPVFIMDARPKTNAWHASFKEVKPWLKEGRYIIGHGLDMAHTRMERKQGWPLLWQGDRIAF
nr:MBL fold metallo-hydrolase [Thiomicrorhabdus cannonii]